MLWQLRGTATCATGRTADSRGPSWRRIYRGSEAGDSAEASALPLAAVRIVECVLQLSPAAALSSDRVDHQQREEKAAQDQRHPPAETPPRGLGGEQVQKDEQHE